MYKVKSFATEKCELTYGLQLENVSLLRYLRWKNVSLLRLQLENVSLLKFTCDWKMWAYFSLAIGKCELTSLEISKCQLCSMAIAKCELISLAVGKCKLTLLVLIEKSELTFLADVADDFGLFSTSIFFFKIFIICK